MIKKSTLSAFLIAGTLLSSFSALPLHAALAASVNLIKNPSVETGGTLPDFWNKGGWGTNTATFTYPAPGIDGTKAMRVDMTAFTSGDAKWVFADVPVKAGTTYVFSDSYMSNVATEADIQYTTTSGGTSFELLGMFPASTGTATKQFLFTTPANASSITIFHLIDKMGYLVTDNYSLTESGGDTVAPTVAITSPTNNATVSGTITATAAATDNVGIASVQFILDGVNFGAEASVSPYTTPISAAAGTHTLSARARDAAGNIATTSLVSFTVTSGGGDTTVPTATITAPANGSSQTGTTTVSVNAADNVGVAGVTILVDNTVIGTEDTVSPYSFLWDTKNATNGTHTLTARVRDTSNNIGTSSPVSITIANTPPPDTTPPSVHLILPTAGTAVATTTPLSFGATDNIGVAGVKLLIDGSVVGAEDTVSPYDFLWDTTTVPNGPHLVSAQARDAAGNIATSTSVELTVNNVAVPPNLIANPMLETVGANGDPASWFRGSWGTSTVAFTYPVTGMDGGKTAKIDVANYVSGDAKWFFADVPVTTGQTYSFTNSYKSSAPTELVARYQTSSGVLYQFIATVPTSSVWKTETYNIMVPAGVTALTVFHSIATNGSLEIDNYSLTLGATPPPPSEVFSRGLVSLSFDDGWVTQYNDALPILKTAGMKGTFYIVSQETLNAVPEERITNPLLETVGTNGDPANWFRGGWGTNTATFTYPVTGIDGGKAAKLDVTNYTDGDAKWYFGDTSVLPNEDYVLTDSYKSTTPSIMTIRYTYLDNTVQYVDIATIPSSGGAWKNFTQTITIPANVDTVTVFHLLRGNGSLTVDNYSLKMVPIYINPTQLLEFQNAGQEIGGHTQTHVSLSTVPQATANTEIVGSRNDLFGMGVTSLDTMAYPYGDYNASVETMAKNAGFGAARSVDRGFNTKSTNKYELKIQQMDRTTTMTDVQTWVAQAARDKTWLILMFHQEDNNPAHDLGVSPAFLQQVVDYVKTANVDVVTVAQGVSQMNP